MSVGYPKYIEGLKKMQEAWKAAYAKLPTAPLTPLMPLNPFNPFNVTMPEWPKLEMPTPTATTAGAYPTFGAWTPGWPFVQPTASSAQATTGTATVETTPAADATAAATTTTAQAATTQAAPTALDAKPAAVPTAEATAKTEVAASPTAVKARGAASLSSRDAYKVVEKAKDIFDDDSKAKPKRARTASRSSCREAGRRQHH